MPRAVSPRFLSPFATRNAELMPISQALPLWAVRGISRGLLVEAGLLSSAGKGRLTTKWIDRAEKRLIRDVRTFVGLCANRLTEFNEERLTDAVSANVQHLFKEIGEHSYVVLNADSDLIIPALTREGNAEKRGVYAQLCFSLPYDETDRQPRRKEWLAKELPGILDALSRYSFCLSPSCVTRPRLEVPTDGQLNKEWSCVTNAGQMRNMILGHFHGISAPTVKRLLSKPPQVSKFLS